MSTQTSSLYGEPAAHEAGLHRSLPLERGGSVWYEVRPHRDTDRNSYSEANNRGKGCRGANIHLLGHTEVCARFWLQEEAGRVGKD